MNSKTIKELLNMWMVIISLYCIDIILNRDVPCVMKSLDSIPRDLTTVVNALPFDSVKMDISNVMIYHFHMMSETMNDIRPTLNAMAERREKYGELIGYEKSQIELEIEGMYNYDLKSSGGIWQQYDVYDDTLHGMAMNIYDQVMEVADLFVEYKRVEAAHNMLENGLVDDLYKLVRQQRKKIKEYHKGRN